MYTASLKDSIFGSTNHLATMLECKDGPEIDQKGSVEGGFLKSLVTQAKELELYFECAVEMFNEFTHRKVF